MISTEDERLIAGLRPQVTATALEHSSAMPAEQLGWLLEYEWERAGLDRDSGTSLVAAVLAVTAQSAREVPRHLDSPGTAAGIVCDGTLRWAAAHRLASARHAYVAGLIAAAVTRALLGDMREDGTSPGEGQPGQPPNSGPGQA